MSFLPYGRQDINDTDVAAVAAALRAALITQGPMVDEFEQALAQRVGARHAVAFNSGTAALHAAYAAAGIGPGKAVVTSPITFVATANASLYLGGNVIFADIDPRSGLIDPELVDQCTDHRIRVVAPVHFGGEVANLQELVAIAEARRWLIVEDAAHALGATYRADGRWHQVGACDHSDLCCFSFHPVKQITTGEGGAVTTNDEELYQRLKRFRTHGITRATPELERSDGPWYYEQHELGYNYRITDFQCALGLSQLDRLEPFLARRRQIAGWYRDRLQDVPEVEPLERPEWSRGAHHLFVVLVPPERRLAIYHRLYEHGIGANVHYIPVYSQPYYRKHGFAHTSFRGAETYYSAAITLPLFSAMTEADVDRVVGALRQPVGAPSE
jgi:UDP-4-amino-4,6-dideoxy-N-acetyl-beta-L-altrosamine transaminase